MTAELVEDVTLRTPRRRPWSWDDLQDIRDDGHRYEIIDGSLHVGLGTPAVIVHALDGRIYREVVTVSAGEAVTVHVPFQVELRPAGLVGPRRRR